MAKLARSGGALVRRDDALSCTWCGPPGCNGSPLVRVSWAGVELSGLNEIAGFQDGVGFGVFRSARNGGTWSEACDFVRTSRDVSSGLADANGTYTATLRKGQLANPITGELPELVTPEEMTEANAADLGDCATWSAYRNWFWHFEPVQLQYAVTFQDWLTYSNCDPGVYPNEDIRIGPTTTTQTLTVGLNSGGVGSLRVSSYWRGAPWTFTGTVTEETVGSFPRSIAPVGTWWPRVPYLHCEGQYALGAVREVVSGDSSLAYEITNPPEFANYSISGTAPRWRMEQLFTVEVSE